MTKKLRERLKTQGDTLPTASDYVELVGIACKRFKIKDREDARGKFRDNTYEQWRINLGVKK